MGNILVVDDEHSIRMTVKAFLEEDVIQRKQRGHPLKVRSSFLTVLLNNIKNDEPSLRLIRNPTQSLNIPVLVSQDFASSGSLSFFFNHN